MPGFDAKRILKQTQPQKPVPPPKPVVRPEPVAEPVKRVVSEPVVEKAVDTRHEGDSFEDVVQLPVQSIVSEPQEPLEDDSEQTSSSMSFIGTKSIKDIPAGVIAIAKREFPGVSNKDALTAYVYLKSGKAFPVDQKIKKLVERRNASTITFESLADSILSVNNRLDGISLALSEIELGLAYVLYDRLGFRQGDTTNVEKLDFLEGSMEGLLQNLRRTTVVKVKQDAVHAGRKRRPMNELKT